TKLSARRTRSWRAPGPPCTSQASSSGCAPRSSRRQPGRRRGSPVVYRAVAQPGHGQVAPLIGIARRGLLVEGDAQAGGVGQVQHAVRVVVAGLDLLARRRYVVHVLLDAEVRDGEVEVQRSCDADG